MTFGLVLLAAVILLIARPQVFAGLFIVACVLCAIYFVSVNREIDRFNAERLKKEQYEYSGCSFDQRFSAADPDDIFAQAGFEEKCRHAS
jgi:hypothetical protein